MKFDYKKIIDEVISTHFFRRFAIMMVGVFALAINYNLFLYPNDIVLGGVSGIATICHSYYGINPATLIFILNIVFVVLCYYFLGKKNTGLTIIGSICYPLLISLTGPLCKKIAATILVKDYFLIVVVSGLLYGVANGVIYKTGFNTGGLDILMQIISKYFNVPRGQSSFIVNFLVIVFGGVTFGFSKAVYSVLIIYINSQLVDRILMGISDSKMFYIVTKKEQEIKNLIREMKSGYTILKTDSGYLNKDKNIIMCVLHTRDYYVFRNSVEKIDPSAFFIISDCYEVYGGHRREKYPFL